MTSASETCLKLYHQYQGQSPGNNDNSRSLAICASSLPNNMDLSTLNSIFRSRRHFFVERRDLGGFWKMLHPFVRGRGYNIWRGSAGAEGLIKRRVVAAAQAFVKVKGFHDKLEVLLFYLKQYRYQKTAHLYTF